MGPTGDGPLVYAGPSFRDGPLPRELLCLISAGGAKTSHSIPCSRFFPNTAPAFLTSPFLMSPFAASRAPDSAIEDRSASRGNPIIQRAEAPSDLSKPQDRR